MSSNIIHKQNLDDYLNKIVCVKLKNWHYEEEGCIIKSYDYRHEVFYKFCFNNLNNEPSIIVLNNNEDCIIKIK